MESETRGGPETVEVPAAVETEADASWGYLILVLLVTLVVGEAFRRWNRSAQPAAAAPAAKSKKSDAKSKSEPATKSKSENTAPAAESEPGSAPKSESESAATAAESNPDSALNQRISDSAAAAGSMAGGVVIARLDDNRPFFFMEASECAAKLKEWKASHPESENTGGIGAILMHVTGLGSAVGAVNRLNARIIPRAADLELAASLPTKEEVVWSEGKALPLFACHGLLQLVNGAHVKPLFLDGDDAQMALAQGKQAAGAPAGAQQLELIVVSLQKMTFMMTSGKVNPDGLRFVPPSKSLRAVAMLEQQATAARASQPQPVAGVEADPDDDPPPLEDDPNETEVD